MRKIISMLVRHWIKTPVKISMTLLSVALGTSILILSFSADSIIKEEITTLMNSGGTIVQVVNGEWGDDGTVSQERPTQWDSSINELLLSDSSTITNVTTISNFPIPNINVNGTSYQIRSAVGTDENYLDLFSLEIIAGVPMSNEDFTNGYTKIWLSEETAEIIFGSAEEAIGKQVSPPGRPQGRGDRDFKITQFTVAGVYETPTEVKRRAYGVADIVIPMTSFMPTNFRNANMLDFLSGRMVVKSSSLSFEKIVADINQVIASNFGEDVNTAIWEGTPNGESSYMEELRKTVNVFSIALKVLGIVLLLTSSLGVFSIMVVEALGRRREIAIERALGASRIQIIKEFWGWSIILSCFGGILGIGLSYLLSGTVLGSMSPLISELTAHTFTPSIKVIPLINGVLLTLFCGGFLGLLPSFGALKGGIADTLREV